MMANRKAVAAAVLLCLCCVRFRGDAVSVSPSPADPPPLEQEQEVQMLKSKVGSLEDEISRRKEETSQLESVVRERTAQMVTLVSELEALQNVNVADDESVMKANTHNAMLEEQIERLGGDLEDQVRKGELLEARATEAEKKVHEFSHKSEHAEKTSIVHRQKIQELNDRLNRAQEKLSELESEAKLKAEELGKVHSMWLPHWLAVHVIHCQELASAKWQVHGKPVIDPLMQKVAEKSTYARRLVELHLQKAQDKLVPVAKVHISSLRNTTAVYALVVANRGSTAYRVCRNAIQPGMVKAQESLDRYWQDCKRFSQPYVSHIVAASEPHLSRANAVIGPYTRPVASSWRRLVCSTSGYHRQVQRGVKHFVESTELPTPLSADRLARLTASGLLVLPVLTVYKFFSATVRKRFQARRKGRDSPNRKPRRRVDM